MLVIGEPRAVVAVIAVAIAAIAAIAAMSEAITRR